jgi:predicted HicB family RNase H-like nuclease
MAMTAGTENDVRRYLTLPYRIAVIRDEGDEDTPWRAVVEELPGCEVRGSTPADAAARIPAALADWVTMAQADGREIPEPRDARNYSGRLLLRMSRSLHSELAQAADRDQVSLNAYINYLLVGALRQPAAKPAAADPDLVPVDETPEPADNARLHRFLAIALAANVAIAAILGTIAVILLVNAG